MSRIIAIIQARTGARRLPNKILLRLEGKTVLEHVIDRVRRSRLVDEIIVATTVLENDLNIVKLCSSKTIRVYCGAEDDVLDRYYQAARLLRAHHIVRITADCPLIDYKIIDQVISLHLERKSDYTANTIKETFPDGEDVEIFKFKTLNKAWQNARISSEREHVSAYIRKHPKLFKLANLASKENFSSYRWTLDEKEDYEFIKLIYKKLYRKNRFFGMYEICKLLKQHPEYAMINNRFKRNEGYSKSLKQDKILNLDYSS